MDDPIQEEIPQPEEGDFEYSIVGDCESEEAFESPVEEASDQGCASGSEVNNYKIQVEPSVLQEFIVKNEDARLFEEFLPDYGLNSRSGEGNTVLMLTSDSETPQLMFVQGDEEAEGFQSSLQYVEAEEVDEQECAVDVPPEEALPPKNIYECEVCKKNFPHRASLKLHIRLHSREKAFICNVCDYQTAQKRDLRLHIRIHTVVKKFNCEMCSYSTSDRRNFQRHTRNHGGGDKPYKYDRYDDNSGT